MILAMDDGHRTPRYRDVQHPSPPRGLDPAADARALAEQDDYVAYMLGKSPRMMSAHPYLDQKGDSEAEDEYVYSLDFDLAYPLWYLRSEEHTSELQSLMRIAYAVFCLKKKR